MAPRVAVYAIAKDEATQVARWAASAADADVVVLVDTGSSDDTAEVARRIGIEVHEVRVAPFRFDVARNAALDLLPSDVDICVPLDLDETLSDGWRAQLDAAWTADATRATFRRTWFWDDDAPPQRYRDDRIHARHGHRWVHPVHERTVVDGPEQAVDSELEIVHHRDPAARRPRYLDLLLLAVAEDPVDGRLAHLLANEYRLRGMTEEARAAAHQAIEQQMPRDELAHCLLMLAWLEPELGEHWLVGACQVAPDRREPWCELARHQQANGRWRASLAAVRAALAVTRPGEHYLENPHAWSTLPASLGALAAENLGDLDAAVRFAREACRAAPTDRTAAAELARLTARLRHPRVPTGSWSA